MFAKIKPLNLAGYFPLLSVGGQDAVGKARGSDWSSVASDERAWRRGHPARVQSTPSQGTAAEAL